MNIRKANQKDIETLITLRIQQLDEECAHPDVDLHDALYTYFNEHLNNDLIQLVMTDEDDVIISTAGIMWLDIPPGFFNIIGTRGYICSVYTKKEYRRNGYSTSLIKQLIEYAREYGTTRLFLEANNSAISVYKKLGFTMHDEMMELKI